MPKQILVAVNGDGVSLVDSNTKVSLDKNYSQTFRIESSKGTL